MNVGNTHSNANRNRAVHVCSVHVSNEQHWLKLLAFVLLLQHVSPVHIIRTQIIDLAMALSATATALLVHLQSSECGG